MTLAVALALALAGGSGWATSNSARLAKGREVYETACLSCHGKDGAGNPEWESEVRPVPFNDCGTIAEPTDLWTSVVVNGGPKHGLSDVMPAFGDAFSKEELTAVVTYLRTFCAEADKYPPGDLNFRRMLRTGKAFPEAEVVIAAEVVPDERETELEIAYENRIGPRFQYEVEFPLRPSGTREGLTAGIGDIAVQGKYVLSFNPEKRRILSGGLEVSLPTGSEANELSDGTAVFKPFLAFGQSFSRTTFQSRLMFEIPKNDTRASRVWNYSVGYALPAIGFSRTGFIPTIEVLGKWSPQNHTHATKALVGVSKALNKLGHIIGSIGVAVPFRPTRGEAEIHAYLLWDFGDGPIWLGW